MQLFFIRHAQSKNNALYSSGRGGEIRSHDPALTELGRRQAACLAEGLARANPGLATDQADSQNRAGFGLTHIYCSLMLRAVATGTAVADRLGLPLHAWLDWHEEGGLYLDGPNGERLPVAGPGRADFARDYPRLVLPDDLTDAGWWLRPVTSPAERLANNPAERPATDLAEQPANDPAERLAERPFEEQPQRPLRAQRVLAELLARHTNPDDRVAVISHGGFYNHIIGALTEQPLPYRLNHLLNNTSISRVALTAQGNYLVYQNRCEHLPDDMITY